MLFKEINNVSLNRFLSNDKIQKNNLKIFEIFFAKLGLVIIYDYIINNKKKLKNLKDDIKYYIKNYDNDKE